MLNLIALSMFTWLNIWGQPKPELQPLELFPWHDSAIFNIPLLEPDLRTKNIVQAYLKNLDLQNIDNSRQGIWIQSGWNALARNQGTKLLPAASLTKIATTLAALDKWGARHQFATNIYSTGEFNNGVITGDLIVEGSGDPLFVWEEAIALGNTLHQLGLKSIQGNLLVTDKFYMNYQDNSKNTGELLKEGFDSKLWQSEITRQYLQMPAGTLQPQIAIAGEVKVIKDIPANTKLLVTHQSLPLAEILRQMNIYSNNKMAQMLADLLGGAKEIAKFSAQIADFPSEEIELVNGSGLGEENRISPRAVCQMLITIDKLLQNGSLSATDLFPTAGRDIDIVGTLQDRGLPTGTTIKTGTLNNVSALAGVIPLNNKSGVMDLPGDKIYFSVINYGSQVKYFRQQQDILINELVQTRQLIPNNFNLARVNNWYLGDPKRNKLNTID